MADFFDQEVYPYFLMIAPVLPLLLYATYTGVGQGSSGMDSRRFDENKYFINIVNYKKIIVLLLISFYFFLISVFSFSFFTETSVYPQFFAYLIFSLAGVLMMFSKTALLSCLLEHKNHYQSQNIENLMDLDVENYINNYRYRHKINHLATFISASGSTDNKRCNFVDIKDSFKETSVLKKSRERNFYLYILFVIVFPLIVMIMLFGLHHKQKASNSPSIDNIQSNFSFQDSIRNTGIILFGKIKNKKQDIKTLDNNEKDKTNKDLSKELKNIQNTNFIIFSRFMMLFFLSYAPLGYFYKISQYSVLRRKKKNSGLGLETDASVKIGSFILIAISSLIALVLMDVEFGKLGLMTGFVAAGLSIALRDTIGNLVAGIQLIWDGSLKKGDVITIPNTDAGDTGSTYGIVEHVRVRYTVVQDRNTVRRLIPNYILTQEPIEHWTHENDMVRLSLRIGIAYGSPIRDAIKIMESVCFDVNRVVTERPPQAMLVECGDYSLIFSIRFWIVDSNTGIRPVTSEILINLIDRLEEAGIEIPLPQSDVNISSNGSWNVVLEGRPGKIMPG